MNILLYVVLLLMLVLTIVGALLAARPNLVQLRRIGAYNAMPLSVGESVESDRTVHISFGSSAINDTSALAAVAASEILYHLAERAALADKPPLVTMSEPITLTLGWDALRRAYKARGALSKYRTTMARWYPGGPNSLVFGAGVGAALLDEDVSTNVLIGRFGAELALIAENALRYDRFVIAQSDQVTGQSVAYAVSDNPLVGEELYAAAAYLGRQPFQIGGAFAQDILRAIVIALMLGLFALAVVGAKF